MNEIGVSRQNERRFDVYGRKRDCRPEDITPLPDSGLVKELPFTEDALYRL